MLAKRSPMLSGARKVSLARPVAAVPRVAKRAVVVRAQEQDFDAVLNSFAEKFEKSENKPAIIGYSAAALGAFFTAEWLIHLPLLDFLLGFPLQVLGLLMVPVLGMRYVVQGKDVGADVSDSVSAIVAELPGLGKK